MITFTAPTQINLNVSQAAISCGSTLASITANASGGTPTYKYKLNTGTYQNSGTFPNLTAATYTVTVKDDNGCTKTATILVALPSPLTTSASNSAILCNGGTSTITVTATGGTTAYQYKLNTGTYQAGNTFAGVTQGTYTITTKDANNCTASTTITITQPTILTTSATSTAILCNGGTSTITVTAAGGTTAYQYKLNTGTYQTGNTFAGVTQGTYTITTKDANNCTATTSITITEPALLMTSASASAILCNGNTSTITVTTTGGTPTYQYQLNTGVYQSGNTFAGISQGTYTITSKDVNNCTASTVITITQPPVLTTSASSTAILCNGGTSTITVTATGGTTAYQYKLNTGSYQAGNTFAGVTQGMYTITTKDANNCTASTTITITQPTILTTSATSTAILCNGGTSTITVTAAGGTTAYQYKLNTGTYQTGNTFAGVTQGTYTITTKDANNCTATTSITITEPALLMTSASASAILCNGNTSTITVTTTGGTPTYQYQLNTGVYQSGNTFAGISQGTYTITSKDVNNCTASTVITITQPPVLTTSASSTAILCNGGTSTITVLQPAVQQPINTN